MRIGSYKYHTHDDHHHVHVDTIFSELKSNFKGFIRILKTIVSFYRLIRKSDKMYHTVVDYFESLCWGSTTNHVKFFMPCR